MDKKIVVERMIGVLLADPAFEKLWRNHPQQVKDRLREQMLQELSARRAETVSDANLIYFDKTRLFWNDTLQRGTCLDDATVFSLKEMSDDPRLPIDLGGVWVTYDEAVELTGNVDPDECDAVRRHLRFIGDEAANLSREAFIDSFRVRMLYRSGVVPALARATVPQFAVLLRKIAGDINFEELNLLLNSLARGACKPAGT